jgi:hypothetical protein
MIITNINTYVADLETILTPILNDKKVFYRSFLNKG